MAKKTEELIYEGEKPVRVDRFLAEHFKGISRAYLQSLISRSGVKINDRLVRKGAILKRGDRVNIEPFEHPNDRRIKPNPSIPIEIVWSSNEIVVVNKPAGLPTHPNEFEDEQTLANALLAKFPEVLEVGDDPLRPGIVHRLDSDTSGLLFAARTQEAFLKLRKLFHDRKVKKTYLALVVGRVSEVGEISVPLAHHPKNRQKMVAVASGVKFRSTPRVARTLYEPIKFFENYTLLRVRTLTGRMHQVRVHLASIGHPLVGDRLYQATKERNLDRTGLTRHFLHAVELSAPIGAEDSDKSFTSELAPELAALISKLH